MHTSSSDSTFQSTLPLQGETRWMDFERTVILISIHSPSAGRDKNSGAYYFVEIKFQSTLPLQGETRWMDFERTVILISIHSPSAGRDSNFAHKTSNIPSTPYAKRQIKELFPTPTQQITTFLTLISSISRCESPCIFMCTSHSH